VSEPIYSGTDLRAAFATLLKQIGPVYVIVDGDLNSAVLIHPAEMLCEQFEKDQPQ
jgi:hypothetical protein